MAASHALDGAGESRGEDRFAPDAGTPEARASESRPTIPVPRTPAADLEADPPSGVQAREERAAPPELQWFGSLGRIPKLAIPHHVLREMKLDATTGFLLSLVDGRTAFEDLIHVCAMPPGQALRLYGALRFLGVIEF